MERMHFDKIVLAGGTGFLGTVLADYFRRRCRRIVILTRRARMPHDNVAYVVWDGKNPGPWAAALEGADALINLCGKEVDCRYTDANRAEIYRTRLEPTRALGAAIQACSQPPRLWVNAASATIYRHAEDRAQTESDGDAGCGFSTDVCQAWEDAFFETETHTTRKVALRVSFVLGRSGGAWPKLRRLVRLGLGGHQGSGTQMVSWIHELDFARIVEWLMLHPGQDGVFNATAPGPITNRDLMRSFREAVGMPIGLPAPGCLLDLGARVIGTEPELILKSRWVLPERLQARGFRFCFPEIGPAVRDLVATRI